GSDGDFLIKTSFPADISPRKKAPERGLFLFVKITPGFDGAEKILSLLVRIFSVFIGYEIKSSDGRNITERHSQAGRGRTKYQRKSFVASPRN
ncbi:MAG: hypothetical protein ACJ76H_03995, partial [Bacteriovoracaceae bacterium]